MKPIEIDPLEADATNDFCTYEEWVEGEHHIDPDGTFRQEKEEPPNYEDYEDDDGDDGDDGWPFPPDDDPDDDPDGTPGPRGSSDKDPPKETFHKELETQAPTVQSVARARSGERGLHTHFLRSLRELLETHTQRQVARALGISLPAVSELSQSARDLPDVREGFTGGSALEIIDQYNAGLLTHEAFIDQLARWTFDPHPVDMSPPGEVFTEGTWEVVMGEALDTHIISSEDFDTLCDYHGIDVDSRDIHLWREMDRVLGSSMPECETFDDIWGVPPGQVETWVRVGGFPDWIRDQMKAAIERTQAPLVAYGSVWPGRDVFTPAVAWEPIFHPVRTFMPPVRIRWSGSDEQRRVDPSNPDRLLRFYADVFTQGRSIDPGIWVDPQLVATHFARMESYAFPIYQSLGDHLTALGYEVQGWS
ncbi:MAG: hypothetical protein Q4G30_00205 [Actinomycetaceae bacterium]|nr:hypothetical protein [Actinomycetaceae bacterium]